MQFLFSVVIPLYNKADTIERALCSVEGQTYGDFEVVIVDDGSTDKSVDVVEQFRGIRNLRIFKQSNSGVSTARNRGAQEARGRYVAFLDADDYWLPSHLEDLKEVLNAHPEAKVISTNLAIVFGKDAFCFGNAQKIKRFNIFDRIARHEPFHTSSYAVERNAFLMTGGYDARFSYYEDTELAFRLAERYGDFWAHCRVSVGYMHDADTSLTKEVRKRRLDEYAHLHFLEMRMRMPDVTRQVRRCAKRIARKILFDNMRHNRMGDNLEFKNEFPAMVKNLGWGVRVCVSNPTFESEIVKCLYFLMIILERLVWHRKCERINLMPFCSMREGV